MINKSHIRLLQLNYADACYKYAQAFCEVFGFNSKSAFWVGDSCGGILAVSDYFFDFNDVVKFSIDNHIEDFKVIEEWEDYMLMCGQLNIDAINFQSWYNGAPRIPIKMLEELVKRKEDLEASIKELKSKY